MFYNDDNNAICIVQTSEKLLTVNCLDRLMMDLFANKDLDELIRPLPTLTLPQYFCLTCSLQLQTVPCSTELESKPRGLCNMHQ